MISIVKLSLSGLVALVLLLTSPHIQAQTTHLPVKELKEAIEDALSDAEEIAKEEPYFLVENIRLELQVVQDGSGSGKLSIPVWGSSVELSAEVSIAGSERLEIDLVPKERRVVGNELDINFSQVIQLIREAFKAEKDDSGSFYLTSVVYGTSFALRLDGEGKIDVFFAEIGGAISQEKEQKVVFTLCETTNMNDCVEAN